MADTSAKKVLLEAFEKISFASLSSKELSEIQDFLEKKTAELKFVQHMKRRHGKH